jgi:hypothetical protein
VIHPRGRLFLGVYAPGTLNARLRQLHDARSSALWSTVISGVTAFLVLVRHTMRRRLLALADLKARG